MIDPRLDIESIKQSGFLDIQLTDQCDRACAYCDPSHSQQWRSDIEKFGQYRVFKVAPLADSYRPSNRDQFWDTWVSVYSYLSSVRITGGEPLMDSDTVKILDYIEAFPTSNIRVEVVSGFDVETSLYNEYFSSIARLDSTRKVNIVQTVSIDSGEERHVRYTRNKSQFDRIWGRIDHLVESTSENTTVSILCTVSATTIVGIGSLLERILDIRLLYNKTSNRINISFNQLNSPSWQGIHILPIEYSDRLMDVVGWMERHQDETALRGFTRAEIDSILSMAYTIKNNSELSTDYLYHQRAMFYQFFSEYDKRNFLSFCKAFPEIRHFWKECESHYLRLQ